MDAQFLAQLILIGWASLSTFAWFKIAVNDGLFERIFVTIFFPLFFGGVITASIILFDILYLLIRMSLGFGG